MADLDDVYNTRLLELAGAISRTERLTHPDATGEGYAKLCGSSIVVDVEARDGVFTNFGQTIKACLLGQAAASVVARHIVGATFDEVRAAGEALRAMLKEEGPPPTGRFAELAALEPVRHYKARHASTQLVFTALEDAMRKLESQTVSDRRAI